MQPSLVFLSTGARRLLSIYSKYDQQTNWIPLGFPQKGFKLVPGHEGKSVVLYASLILLPPIQDAVFQEFCSKRYAFMT